MASAAANRRIAIEMRKLDSVPVAGIGFGQTANNALLFVGIITGPEGSPYEGGKFKFNMSLPNNYPRAPPAVMFLTKIYHPNIDNNGNVFLDITDKWNPANQMRAVLESIRALLLAPKPDDSLDNEVNDLWKSDEQQAVKTAKEWTEKYANEL